MENVKLLPSEIKELLIRFEETDQLSLTPKASGARSTVYKIDEYCLKTYTPHGRSDGEQEWQTLLALQRNHDQIPVLYAYSPGKFVLIEWIEGFNLTNYMIEYNDIPTNFLYDLFSSELQLINVGYKDWDFKLYENLIWTKSGGVKRLDLGICDHVGPIQEQLKLELEEKIRKVYANDSSEIHSLEQKLFMNGLNSSEVVRAILSLRSKTPWLV